LNLSQIENAIIIDADSVCPEASSTVGLELNRLPRRLEDFRQNFVERTRSCNDRADREGVVTQI
jgi:hypothetical protein